MYMEPFVKFVGPSGILIISWKVNIFFSKQVAELQQTHSLLKSSYEVRL